MQGDEYINYRLCKEKIDSGGDIFEHLATLYRYSVDCSSILECGVRTCVSSWAFAEGLLKSESEEPLLILNDIDNCDIAVASLVAAARTTKMKTISLWKNDLEIDLLADAGITEVDMTFIDTWHVYAQLRRELAKFAPVTKKYIIMHDTEIDKEGGESLRMGFNVEKQIEETGFPCEEITRGLWPAVEEFLAANPEWTILEHFTNCNGLTILGRRSSAAADVEA